MNNIPKMKIGIVAVSRDCFPESLSVNRRKALVDAYAAKYDAADIYECPVCIVESEIHMVQALEDIKAAGCNALCVYLGNAKIATIQGRFWGMDRDKRWDRVEKGYNAIVCGEGVMDSDPVHAVEASYANDVTDEFVEPVVVIFAPMLKRWAEKHGVAATKLLIPLSYATILGGVCTLIGTSTNLVVHGMVIDAGFQGLRSRVGFAILASC